MENEDFNKFESVYSNKVRAGKRRTYFFDVRKTKKEDFYITITESTRKFDGNGYERHKIFLYKEDFNRFVEALGEVVDHVKTELMPDFDYDLYKKRQEEWEAMQAAQAAEEAKAGNDAVEKSVETPSSEANTSETPTETSTEEATAKEVKDEDDMSW